MKDEAPAAAALVSDSTLRNIIKTSMEDRGLRALVEDLSDHNVCPLCKLWQARINLCHELKQRAHRQQQQAPTTTTITTAAAATPAPTATTATPTTATLAPTTAATPAATPAPTTTTTTMAATTATTTTAAPPAPTPAEEAPPLPDLPDHLLQQLTQDPDQYLQIQTAIQHILRQQERLPPIFAGPAPNLPPRGRGQVTQRQQQEAAPSPTEGRVDE